MAPCSTARTALAALRADLAGEVFAPGDPGYDEARAVCNARIDRRPAVIARCAGQADVVRAVRFARDLDLKIAVRGGGHSVSGMAVNDNGVVVDLRRMREVTVHPGAGAVRLEGGALMRDLDAATQPHALATTGARVSTIGVGGFVLGGGSGWLERAFGLAVDNLLGVELVTADGATLRASAGENRELFRALHGGGGNFGVATALTLRLHELPAFSLALVVFRPQRGPEVIRRFRDLLGGGPPRAGGAVLYRAGRSTPYGPGPPADGPRCAALVTYVGPVDDLRALARPLLALPHESEVVACLPYAAVQGMFDVPAGLRHQWSTEYLTGLPDELIDRICTRARAMPGGTACRHMLVPLGGAVAAGPADSPVPARDAPWALHTCGIWADPADDERVCRWVGDAGDDVQPWRTGAVYLNLVGDEGRDRVVAGIGTENLNRLARVKRRYDPDNVFRYNHNVLPA